jgi:digeranylgeranylglycerophospholipid reductase
MAARVLEKNNINFLGIDSKKEIGLPLKCGEGIREDEFIKFFGNTDFKFVRNKVKEHVVHHKNFKRSFKADFLQLDRPDFEKFLAGPVKDSLRLRTRCNNINIKNNLVEIKTNKETINAKLVILSCGCDYKIQKKFNLVKKKQTFFVCYGGIYKESKLERDKFHAFFDDEYMGYLWVFPKDKNTSNIGFGTVNKGINVKETLTALLKKYGIDAKQISPYAGIISCSGPIKKTYSNRLLVCGNSANQVYAGTGEGIYYALESGILAAKTAVKAIRNNNYTENFLKTYEKTWKKSFGKLMKAGMIFFDLQSLATKSNKLEYLLKKPSDKELSQFIVDGKVPLRARIVWIIGKILNKI